VERYLDEVLSRPAPAARPPTQHEREKAIHGSDGDAQNDDDASRSDWFMTALEVEAQMRATLTHCRAVYGAAFGTVHEYAERPGRSWPVLFLRVLAVPLPQSGPPMWSTTWIELQTGQNRHFDSLKDPVSSIEMGNGIRQLLEKEGMFRKHMMDKCVNYACRSVISPDPYIGVNEIGVPLAFAKTLTHPAPVLPFNVSHFHQLVARRSEKGGDCEPPAAPTPRDVWRDHHPRLNA